MIVAAIILGWLGLALGSFVNVLVWRIHARKDWVKGRSQCPSCGHQLAVRDLLPVLSWLMLRGRCRYCHKPISWQYPLVELGGALVFISSYFFWPGGIHSNGAWVLFISWLAVSVGLLALLTYDFRWMLLPSNILYPTFVLAVIGRLTYLIGFEPNKPRALLLWLLGVAIASGLFWLLFMFSAGNWIGYGDVRLGLITGTVLADPGKSILMIFIASIIGTIFVVPALLSGKKKLASKLPYGPFLITATTIVLLFGDRLINWYKQLFLP